MSPAKPEVLVVEHDKDLLWRYRRWLEEAGCHVREIRHSDTLMKVLQERAPDVLLLRLEVERDGFGMLRRLKESQAFRSMLVVAVTDYLDFGMRQRAIHGGADAVLVKPVSCKELLRSIEGVTGRGEKEDLSRKIRSLERKVWGGH
jgi:two-component system, cell cycle response regulator DivK